MPESENISNAPERFNTHAVKMRAHFETYDEKEKFENGEEDFDPVREEICQHYGVPNDEEHRFIIDNDIVKKQRTRRAFSVVLVPRTAGDGRDGYYIDGRVPHAVLLRRLANHHKVPLADDSYESIHGFLDPAGFPDVENVQTRAQERGQPITWFVRYTVNGSPATPPSPVEL